MANLRGATPMRDPQQAHSFPASPPSANINSDLESTAYHGAAGDIRSHWNAPPAIRFDKDGFQDIQLRDNPRRIQQRAVTTAPTTCEGLGNRLLSTLQQQSASPTATALARSGTVLHNRARSWAAYVPKLNTTNNQPNPTKNQPRPANERTHNKLFGDLFHGESAPVQLGVPASPTKELDESGLVMEYKPSFTERPNARDARRESTMSVTSTKGPAKPSWFSRKISMPVPSAASAKVNAVEDEMLSVNITHSLFPHGPGDPLSPQSYNDLLLNATNLLQRMQASYKEKVDFIASIQPEMDAQKEEVEETEIRSAHLKRQLEDLGRQAHEQKQVNEDLIIKLSETKVELQEEREKNKTIRLVPRDAEGGASDEESHRRGKRRSAGYASDSGFESDADSASLFSSALETPGSHRHPHFMATADHRRVPSPRESVASSTAWSGSTKQSLGETAAWNTVEQLRNENRQLRMQVEQMQQTVQSCIEMVNGLTGGMTSRMSKIEPYNDD